MTVLGNLLSEAQFLAGEDARGTTVVLEPETVPDETVIAALADRGTKGFVSDFGEARFERPDEIPPVTAPCPSAPLEGWAVSFRTGTRLRTLAARGGRGVETEVEARPVAFLAPAVAKTPPAGPASPVLGYADILAAFGRVGVEKGDAVLFHSSLSACGRIDGGAETVLKALMESVGEDGMFFLPTFQRSECFLNGVNKRWDHRPSDWRDRASAAVKWVGAIPLAFLRLYPDAPRGRHISHSWAGWGRGAAELLAKQREDEQPFSDNSVPGLLRGNPRAKIVHFGSPVGHTSFLHHFENHYRLPGLGPAYYEVRREDGSITWRFVPDLVPGPREFYVKDEDARFFREACSRGLEIRRTALGRGFVKAMSVPELWRIGSALVTEDPRIIIG